MALRIATNWVLAPALGFTLGVCTFLEPWPPADDQGLGTITLKRPLAHQRLDILDQIHQHPEFRSLVANRHVARWHQSEKIPHAHRDYHVAQGLLYGPGHLEIDPLVFHDENTKELIVFYHLGPNLGNENNRVHKGVLALLLDEALCYCGFPSLPNKRGVTARLSIDYARDVPVDSTVVLRAHVHEASGRKCVIKGTLETLPAKRWWNPLGRETSTVLASATCILVEPKWFKYVTWFNAF
ncbi:LAFE_0B09538g1_1 [Lachancea fermentati]|uniref:LAFE_0B09538g1_1 n=1 Tax=Lachancea fermentati TaxID=4955 RepID=A0A1G4M8G8_LACFM|nr:LAFE_0B09538g1_1 [Lachancea fermentati]